MTFSNARIATTKSSRYMQQLCKHFAHKRPVTFTTEEGRIEFSAGTCTMDAKADELLLRAQAADEPSLVKLEGVVVRHLQRFAFREPFDVTWVRGAAEKRD
jgi:hypothetical protein